MTERAGWLGHDSQDMTPRTARTGWLGQDSWAEHPRQENLDRRARAGQPEKTDRIVQPAYETEDRKARIWQQGQDSYRRGQCGCDLLGETLLYLGLWTGPVNKTVRIGQFGKIAGQGPHTLPLQAHGWVHHGHCTNTSGNSLLQIPPFSPSTLSGQHHPESIHPPTTGSQKRHYISTRTATATSPQTKRRTTTAQTGPSTLSSLKSQSISGISRCPTL